MAFDVTCLMYTMCAHKTVIRRAPEVTAQFTHTRKSMENDGHVEICLEKQCAIVEEEIPPTAAERFGFVTSHAGQVTAALLPRLA